MRKLFFLLFALSVWVGCNKNVYLPTQGFTHSGCAVETKAGLFDEPSFLTLKYRNGHLLVIRTNAIANCAFKVNGLSCVVTMEGDVIHYRVEENDGLSANCICRIEEMSSEVAGLQEGREYTFDYSCCGRSYAPFTFVFTKDLIQIQDMDNLEPGPEQVARKELELTAKSAEIVRKGSDFAFKLIDRVNAAEEGSFFISPLSLQFLLGMVLDGARGTTADEICQVLGFGAGEVDAVNEYSQSLLSQLPVLDEETIISIGNALMVNQKYSLLDSYQSAVKQFYLAEVSNKDFTDIEGTTRYINDWCSRQTNGLIPQILDTVDPAVVSYLMNALYFKGAWASPFEEKYTAEEVFTQETGATVKVSMMKNHNAYFPYKITELFSAVRLPYGNGNFAMTLILPAEGKSISEITSSLNGAVWEKFSQTMYEGDLSLWLPRFETKFSIYLQEILSAMGMPSVFDSGKANLGAMSDVPLYLDYVKQDAVIKVNEQGSEAAAVSVGSMVTSLPPSFHANRPFLYLISETSTSAILFAGKYCGD